MTECFQGRRRSVVEFALLRGIGGFDAGDGGGIGFGDAVARGVGIDQAAIEVNLRAIDQPGLDAIAHGAHEERFEEFAAPALARFGEHAVVGDRVIQAVAEEPQPIEALRQTAHQLALAAHVLLEEQEHQLEQNRRVERDVAVVSVGGRDHLSREGKIDQGQHPAQWVLGMHAFLQIDLVTKQLRLG